MEADLKSICDGNSTPDQVLIRSVNRYKEMFLRTIEEFSKITSSMDRYFREREDSSHRNSRGRGRGGGGGFRGGHDGGGGGAGGGGNPRGGRGSRGGRGGLGNGFGRGNYGGNDNNDGDNDSTSRGRGSRGRYPRGRGRGRGSNSNNQNEFHSSRPTSEPPQCMGHQRPMVLRTVVKEGPNKGREFYKCADNTQCDSFEWADKVNTSTFRSNNNATNSNSNVSSSSNSHNYNNNNNNSGGGSATPYCHCGKNCVEHIVRKETENKGRAFYCCAAGKDKGCDYFEWVDQM